MRHKQVFQKRSGYPLVLVMVSVGLATLSVLISGCDLGTYGRRFKEQEAKYQQQASSAQDQSGTDGAQETE